MLSATAIVLLDSPMVRRPESLTSLVVVNSSVAPVSKIPMVFRDLSLMPSWFGVSYVL